MEAVGYSDDFENFTLCQSIERLFQVFNVAPIILVNVLDPNKAAHVTQNQAESCDVVDGVVLYDKKYVLLNTLAVKNGSAPWWPAATTRRHMRTTAAWPLRCFPRRPRRPAV